MQRGLVQEGCCLLRLFCEPCASLEIPFGDVFRQKAIAWNRRESLMSGGLQGSWHKSPLLLARATEQGQHMCDDARRGALYVHTNASDMPTLPIFQRGREDHLAAGESGQYNTLGRGS